MKFAVIAAVILYAAILVGQTVGMRPTPRCAEDQVLIGTGEFVAGRWESFKCGPAVDDFVTL